jgi:hypothetical protein
VLERLRERLPVRLERSSARLHARFAGADKRKRLRGQTPSRAAQAEDGGPCGPDSHPLPPGLRQR